MGFPRQANWSGLPFPSPGSEPMSPTWQVDSLSLSHLGSQLNWLSSVQFSSVAQSCPTLCNPMNCSTPALSSITNSQSSLRLMSIELVMLSNHPILCHPLPLPPSIFPSIRVFSNESVLCIRWPKNWSLSFNISLSDKYSGLISFRIDWLDLAVQGTLKSSPT